MAAPSLADFETEDQEALKAFAKPPAAKPAATTLDNLMSFANQHHYRVTSSNTGRHNPGSKHYRGEAIDIDHRNINRNDLMAAASAAGFRVLDETTRPKGQAVWGGPHYHVEAGGQKKAAAPSVSPAVQKANRAALAKAREPVSVSSFELSPEEKNYISQFVAGVKTEPVAQAGTEKPEPSNFFSDLSGAFQNTISGYTRDDLARASGGGIGAGLGNIAGSLVDIGGAGLAGAGLGSVVPGVGTALGGTAGLVAGGAGLGALQEAQRERLAGEEYNPLKLVGAGAIGGLTSFPVGGAASTVAKTILKNAAIDAGINTAGDVALQAVEKGTLDPRQLDLGRAAQAAGIGAVGGGLSGWHAAHAKVKQAAPVLAEKLAKGAPLDHVETRALGQILTPDEVQALQEGFRQRTVGDTPQIITQPFDETQAVRDLGLRQPVQEQVSDTGLTVMREGATKPEAPPLQIERGLPEGEQVDLSQRPTRSETILDPTTGQPFKPTERYLRPSLDIGIERAERVYSRDLADVPAKAAQVEITGPKEIRSPGILDAQGRRIGEELPVRDLVDVKGRTLSPSPFEGGQRYTNLAQAEEFAKSVQPNTKGKMTVETGPDGYYVMNRDLPSDLVDPTGRPMDLAAAKQAPKDLATPPAKPEQPPGAFTDTVNELLKDSGTDWQGVQNLKRELDAKRVEVEAYKNNRTRSAEAKQARADLKQLNDRWKALDPNIREAAGVEFDSQTGVGRQRAVDAGSQLSLEQIRGDLDERSLPMAERYAEAMQKGVKVRHKYIGEQVGRSNEVAKRSKGGRAVVETTEFSPTHFGYFNATFADGARKVPAVFGYNQRGHEVGYYLNKSPKGSMVQQVMAVTDKPAFRGAIPNVAQGSGEFNVSDLLARGSRSERGFVKTSEAIRAIHEQKTAMREVMNSAIMPAEAKQKLTKVLSEKDFGYDDIRSLRETMSNPGRLAEFCTRMGLS